ncbi:MAG TPA: hypothetical protein VME43_24155 [Bryobacteraceae bacterium]|nr:hypothetical protein [Bryobacteraceae bacterium]
MITPPRDPWLILPSWRSVTSDRRFQVYDRIDLEAFLRLFKFDYRLISGWRDLLAPTDPVGRFTDDDVIETIAWRLSTRELVIREPRKGQKGPPAGGGGGQNGNNRRPPDKGEHDEPPPVTPEIPEKKLDWIEVHLIPLPPKWSSKTCKAYPDKPTCTAYPYERFSADVTDGHKDSRLDGNGSARYDQIPAGVCEWQFTNFFDAVEKALKPAPAVANAKSIAGPPHPPPVTYTVDLSVQKPLLTLKHNDLCELEIQVLPQNTVVDDYRIEIKRASGGQWLTLANAREMKPWTAKIAGKFKLRGVAEINGSAVSSVEQDVEVQFPSYNQIILDSDVIARTDLAWNRTQADCTTYQPKCLEYGFWIYLNTTADCYQFGRMVQGQLVEPLKGADVVLGLRPPDQPANPSPTDPGATYAVASFHAHPTVEYLKPFFPQFERDVGPSPGDEQADREDAVPGVIYDYVDSPAGSGTIPYGHPTNAPAKLYRSKAIDRRPTP